jgi:hypothetical protein
MEVKIMDISSSSIFELLGYQNDPAQEEKKFQKAIDNTAWVDFLSNDAPALMRPSDYVKALDIWREFGDYQTIPAPLIAYVSSEIPHIEYIIQEKTHELKKQLIKERIRDFGAHSDTAELEKLFDESDWRAIAKRLKAVRFEDSLFELLDRAAHKQAEAGLSGASSPEEKDELILQSMFEPADEFEEIADSSSGREKGEMLCPHYRLEDAIMRAIKTSGVIMREEEFLARTPEDFMFSYQIDSGNKLFNEAILRALKDLLAARSEKTARNWVFKSVNDFRTVFERNSDYEFDYSDLNPERTILCVEDFDLLSSLSAKEFKKFVAFLKSNSRHRFFFFGDFSPRSSAFDSRMKELEAALNIRYVDANQIEIDETGILLVSFFAAGVSVPPEVRETLFIAWEVFRSRNQEGRLDEIMRVFVSKTEFLILSKTDDMVVCEDSFSWLGLTAGGGSPSEPASRPDALRALDKMVGLEDVKGQIEQFAAHALVSKKKAGAGMEVEPNNLSFLFLGNPGTGKTTTARILAQALRELGILKKGHLVTASRGTLIGRYTGQTAPLVTETFISALDGALFIDEAYSLNIADSSRDSYGEEAINTLTLLMSEFAGRICVILAGYEEEMDYMLESANPGLRDRFVYRMNFGDYSEAELWQIFSNKLGSAGLVLEDGGDTLIRQKIARLYEAKDERFANARVMNNLYQSLINIQETRIASEIYQGRETSPAELASVTTEDCRKLLRSEACQYSTREEKLIGFAV